MRTLARSLAFATVLAFGTACGDNDSNAPDTSHLGTYTLQSALGDPVPSIIIDDPDYRLEMLNGTLTLNGNGTWTENTTWRETENGTSTNIPTTCNGTFTRSAGNITLTQSQSAACDADTFAATFTNGNTITVEPNILSIVYRK